MSLPILTKKLLLGLLAVFICAKLFLNDFSFSYGALSTDVSSFLSSVPEFLRFKLYGSFSFSFSFFFFLVSLFSFLIFSDISALASRSSFSLSLAAFFSSCNFLV